MGKASVWSHYLLVWRGQGAGKRRPIFTKFPVITRILSNWLSRYLVACPLRVLTKFGQIGQTLAYSRECGRRDGHMRDRPPIKCGNLAAGTRPAGTLEISVAPESGPATHSGRGWQCVVGGNAASSGSARMPRGGHSSVEANPGCPSCCELRRSSCGPDIH